MNEDINIMFLGDDGQLWYSDNFVKFQLDEKDKEITRLSKELISIFIEEYGDSEEDAQELVEKIKQGDENE